MKKDYLIDFNNVNNRETLHEYLKENLELPEYYGKNLDALSDCLTQMSETTITFRNLSSLKCLGEYEYSLLEVLEDSAKENPELTLLFFK